MAAALTITNKVKDVLVSLERGRSPPVNQHVKTHIREGFPNPKYEGSFYILVTYTLDCDCMYS